MNPVPSFLSRVQDLYVESKACTCNARAGTGEDCCSKVRRVTFKGVPRVHSGGERALVIVKIMLQQKPHQSLQKPQR